MQSARDQILSNIKANRSAECGDVGESRAAIRLPRPQFSDAPESSLASQFEVKLGQVHGTCGRIHSMEEVPDHISDYLSSMGENLEVVLTPHEDVAGLDWHGFECRTGIAQQEDRVSVTRARAGIAETGTVVLESSAASPVTLNFLPEVNIAVLLESELVAFLEDYWITLGRVPRTVNFITGPSKTADIEQTIVYGAHGPRKFHVVLVSQSQR